MNETAVRIVIRPSRPTPSRTTRWLGWLGLPWLLLVLIGTDAVLDVLGLPPGERPLLLRLLVAVSAVLPIGLYVSSPWLGRLPSMSWLLASPQPEAELDADGIRLRLPDHPDQYIRWSAIAGLRLANNWPRDSVLIGVDGQHVATIPWSLAQPRGRVLASRPLAQQVIELRPDRFALTGTNWAGLPDQFGLRDAAGPAPSVQDSVRRQRLVFGGIIAALLVVSIVAAAAWLTSSP